MIIFSSVTKQFGDRVPALDDVSFEISEGDLAVITGPSGSGKTSLMRLLTKEYIPSSGKIIFNDVPLDEIRHSQIHHHRRNIGVVFQDYKLLNELNVWENIALALSIIGAPTHEIETRVTDLLNLVNLVDKAFLFPSQLSGGEAQRVSIARALSTAPKVIFADEPTGNLDPDTSRSIIHLLKKINELGTTIMITTHDPVVLEAAGGARHLHLEKGKLVKDSGKSKKKTDKDEPKTDRSESEKSESKSKEKEEKEESAKKTTKPKTPDEPETKKRVSIRILSFLSPFSKKPDKKAAEAKNKPAKTEMKDDQENTDHVEVEIEKLDDKSDKKASK